VGTLAWVVILVAVAVASFLSGAVYAVAVCFRAAKKHKDECRKSAMEHLNAVRESGGRPVPVNSGRTN
jgi:hypothetical protein